MLVWISARDGVRLPRSNGAAPVIPMMSATSDGVVENMNNINNQAVKYHEVPLFRVFNNW